MHYRWEVMNQIARLLYMKMKGMLIISNEETQQETIRYPLCIEKGRLIKSE